MAICKSHLFSMMVNSIGGVTYFRTRYCQIVARNRTIPADPNTPAQQTIRTTFGTAAAQWALISEDDRAAWKDFADQTPWLNKLGQVIHLTAQSMYIAIRTANTQCTPTAPPATWNRPPKVPGLLPQPHIDTTDCPFPPPTNVGQKVEITNQSATQSMKFSIYFAGPFNPSVHYYKGPYDPLLYLCTPSVLPGATVSVPYCDLILGRRYFIMVRGLLHPDRINMTTEQYFNFIAK